MIKFKALLALIMVPFVMLLAATPAEAHYPDKIRKVQLGSFLLRATYVLRSSEVTHGGNVVRICPQSRGFTGYSFAVRAYDGRGRLLGSAYGKTRTYRGNCENIVTYGGSSTRRVSVKINTVGDGKGMQGPFYLAVPHHGRR